MTSEREPTNSVYQTPRVIGASICTSCGVEWFSDQKLRREINILQTQNTILNDQLFRNGHVNQLNELRIRTLQHDQKRLAEVTNSSKQAAANLQQDLNTQQATLEAENKEHALTIQSLKHEFKCHEVTERCLEKLTGFLNKLEFSNEGSLSIGLPESMGVGAFLHEQQSMELELKSKNSEVRTLQQELQRTTNELQHGKLVLKNLSTDFQNQSQSRSETCSSYGDEEAEVKTAVLQPVFTGQGKRRRS